MWSDLDLEHGRATLVDTKTGKSQRAIGAPARLLLANLPRKKDAVYVFPGAAAEAPLKDIRSSVDTSKPATRGTLRGTPTATLGVSRSPARKSICQ
jgi:hypothetical protein